VTSLPVGLGEYDSTPVGRFRVEPGKRLINPAWTNPRTGEKYDAGDPKNPIGERWIGLEGIDEGNRDLDGYGIHGTIDPASIGHQRSMGCVRMLPDDVALVYEVLVDGCEVEIRP
jgi:lipoprotein-anchoring transpeptidase ErfK/SrfK